jgi:hypothetical protein
VEGRARSVSSSFSSPALLTLASNNLLLTGVCRRPDMAQPDFTVYELEQWPHVRQASCEDTHSGVDVRPHTGVDLGI